MSAAAPGAPTRGRILVCDDERHLREMVAEYLAERGFAVEEAGDAAALDRALAAGPPDLVVLDITMPGEDGLSVLRRIRAQEALQALPVIMLTAAAEVIDRVVGLELGADDYLGKPVDLRELEARIKVALRRRPGGAPAPAPRPSGTVAIGACRLDLDTARLFGPDGAEIAVTAMEVALLRLFVQNPGRVLDRDRIAAEAHDRGWTPFDRSIDLRISRLRRKIEANPARPEVIRTVRGVGYVFG